METVELPQFTADGFVIEGPTAGGHNAPPRGKLQLNQAREPIYGERDQVDLEKVRELGLPFWLAGGYGSPDKLREALAAGAAGVQVGTPFAYCAESSLREDYERSLLRKVVSGKARDVTDALASPTGFPFKIAQLEGTLSEGDVYSARPRICDLGYLREAYRRPDGEIGYRCPGEPSDRLRLQRRQTREYGRSDLPLQCVRGKDRTTPSAGK